MSQDELDHILASLDFFQIKNKTSMTLNPIIGYLKEFQDQQESGWTSFELPKRVKYVDWFPEASQQPASNVVHHIEVVTQSSTKLIGLKGSEINPN